MGGLGSILEGIADAEWQAGSCGPAFFYAAIFSGMFDCARIHFKSSPALFCARRFTYVVFRHFPDYRILIRVER